MLRFLALAVSWTLLAGCGEKPRPAPGPPVDPPRSKRADPTDRLPLAGIDDPDRARAFVARMAEMARVEDRVALVGMVRFPFTTYSRGTPRDTYRREGELFAVFDEVFTPRVLRAMRAARYEELFVNYQGAMIGNGEVWFDQRDDAIRIKAINGRDR